MNRFRTLVTGLVIGLVAHFTALAQQTYYSLDPAVPAQTITDKSKLTVLASRLGSRFSCSWVAQESGLHTGAMGYDNDQLRPLLAQVNVVGQPGFVLRTGHLSTGSKYFPTQLLRMGMATYQLEGQSGQLAMKLTVVSPFTPSDSLGQHAQVKTSLAPLHYLIVETTNKDSKPQQLEVKLGLQGIPFDRDKEVALSWWRRGKSMNELFFKDVAGAGSLQVLATSGFDGTHFEQDGYQGIGYQAKLAPRSTDTKVYVLAGHYQGKVMEYVPSHQDLTFYYLKYWKNIDEVLAYGRAEQVNNLNATAKFESILSTSKATPEEKWVAALTFRTDLANSFLLQGAKDGIARFYLTEGRFRHMNTIDVAHETETVAIFCPWRLKLQLEQWTDYLATKEVQVPSGRRLNVVKDNLEGVSASEFGPYLYHDVGNFPYVYAAEGYDFGPVMPIEENSNFTLLLYYYWKLTGDRAFMQRHAGLVAVLLQSMMNRDSNGNGVADYAFGWSSYDVSEAIKRSPENLYLGVKQLCAYACGAELLEASVWKATRPKNTALKSTDEDGTTLDGNGKALFEKSIMDNEYLRKRQATQFNKEAETILATLQATMKQFGYLPVSLDQSFEGWNQHSVVISDGLYLPALAGSQSPVLKQAATLLEQNYQKALSTSRTPYGIKLSDGEEVTWFSKIMVGDVVSSYWFNKAESSARYTYNWNRDNHQAYQDGAFSLEKPWPGNWYPRGVSSLPYLFRDRKLAGNALYRWAQSLR